jgi:uncharacterized damage-inducible protein DinB
VSLTPPVGVHDGLASLFYGGSASVSWEQALAGLDEAQARAVPAGLPHGVADLVAHVAFWQAYLLGVFRGEDPEGVESAAESWPGGEDEGWEALQLRFFRDMNALAAYAQDEALLQLHDPQERFRSVPLTSFAGHGLYHLGQVVTVRRLLGAWPPPGGGDTW